MECSICFEPFDSLRCVPIQITCGHTFCRCCLIAHQEKDRGSLCPLCQQPHAGVGAGSLSPNFQVLELITLIKQQAEESIEEKPVIERLSERLADEIAALRSKLQATIEASVRQKVNASRHSKQEHLKNANYQAEVNRLAYENVRLHSELHRIQCAMGHHQQIFHAYS